MTGELDWSDESSEGGMENNELCFCLLLLPVKRMNDEGGRSAHCSTAIPLPTNERAGVIHTLFNAHTSFPSSFLPFERINKQQTQTNDAQERGLTYWKVQIVWYRKKFISVRNQCCRSIVVVRVATLASATAAEKPASLSWLVNEEALIARRPRSRRHSLNVCHETVYLKENEIGLCRTWSICRGF